MEMNFKVIELAYIEQVLYSDGSGSYHLEVHYLIDLNGTETVMVLYPTNVRELDKLPFIEPDTEIRVRSELRRSYHALTTVRAL